MAIFGGEYYELNMEKYSARPITLSHDGILTNVFCVCKWWEAVDADRGVARVNRATHARAVAHTLLFNFLFRSNCDHHQSPTRSSHYMCFGGPVLQFLPWITYMYGLASCFFFLNIFLYVEFLAGNLLAN